jgi:hypothetical protein
MSDNTVTNESSFTKEQVQKAVRGLRKAFRNASNAYWDHMKKNNKRFATFVMHDSKTNAAIYDEGVDYTLYHAQIDFAYIIDDLQRGPACLASQEVKKANDLIETILKKSS